MGVSLDKDFEDEIRGLELLFEEFVKETEMPVELLPDENEFVAFVEVMEKPLRIHDLVKFLVEAFELGEQKLVFPQTDALAEVEAEFGLEDLAFRKYLLHNSTIDVWKGMSFFLGDYLRDF